VAESRVATAQRALLAILSVSGATVGAWAAFAPRAFYDKFPGLGQMWVSVDGPYNEHLVRDVGALNLALAVVSICALVSLARSTVVATGLAWLAYGVPHFVYHARHLGPFDGTQGVSVLASVASTSVVALVILWLERARVPEPARQS
jgi:apolipoprotein N-acyltransferase